MDNNDKSMIAGKLIPAIISIVILVFIDQITKYYINSNMELYDSIPLIQDVFEIHYIRNAGAAWGLLQNKQILFFIITLIVLICGLTMYIRCVKLNKYTDIRILIILIISGAIGNFIDRIRFQYVVDFLYFKLINFPVFNIADCYVTVGIFLLFLILFFKYKEDDINELLKK